MSKFIVGNKVKRKVNIFGELQYVHGTITNVYKSVPNHEGKSIDLYEVAWDRDGVYGNTPIRGYMDIGLELDE